MSSFLLAWMSVSLNSGWTASRRSCQWRSQHCKQRAKFETLLPTIVDAGYADADTHTSRFTPKGIARAEELIPDA